MIYMDLNDWVLAAAAWRAAATLELPAEEGCTTSYALGSLSGYSVFNARILALGLIRLKRYNDLVGLCVDVRLTNDRPQTIDFGQVRPGEDSSDHRLGIYSFLPACAAVQAAAGRGIDPPPPQDRPRVRRLALEWLSADLTTCQQRLATDTDGLRGTAHSTMTRWLTEPHLNDVRGDHIIELPKDEQNEWTQLWGEIGKLRDQTAPVHKQ